ncbi:MAG: alpha/beta hydrolase [Deltaproteobacteria bacterium]
MGSFPWESFRLGAGPCCLLLHGFTGSPAELRPLGELLAREGFCAVAPCLPGHGVEHGSPAGRADWLEAARAALAELAPGGEPVRVAGLSMGALLALSLAAERPERVCALALLAPAARLTLPGALAARFFAELPFLSRALPSLRKNGSDLRDPKARLWTGPTVPTHGLGELDRLAREAQQAARGVRAPTLVLLGGQDRTVDNRAACALADRLPGPVRIETFPRSGHQLATDFERSEVALAVASHFRAAVG